MNSCSRLLSAFGTLILTVACGGSSAKDDPGPTTSGCSTAPACGSCATCFETCVCEGGELSACTSQCSASTGGSGGTGGGGGTGAGAGSGGTTSWQTVTITTDSRKVEPGEEAFFCQNFANPFGDSVDVLESESFMTPGSHHMFVFYEPDATADGAVHDCSGLEYKRTLHTAQTPQHLTKYPPDVGRFIEGSTGLRVMAHYINTGPTAIDAIITVNFKVAPEGTVSMQAGSLFFLNPAIYVGAHQAGQAVDTCNTPFDIQIIDVVSHMHSYGTGFTAKTASGKDVYSTTDWDEPQPAVFDPPLAVAQGDSITYTCNYQNTLSKPLTFGESAIDNEMCILSGTYFPAPGGLTLDCN